MILIESSNCENCKHLIKATDVVYDWYCTFHKDCLPISIIYRKKVLCEIGYERVDTKP